MPPPHADVSLEEIEAVTQHHGLPGIQITRLPDMGIFNAIYALGDRFILRVPRKHPLHYRALWNESIAVPLARGAGVRTPELVVYDDSCVLLPVPYTIYERIQGENFERLGLEPVETANVWREFGRDLARLHTGVDCNGPAARLDDREALPDPRALAEDLAVGGWVTQHEARWLIRWLNRLAPAALTPVTPRFLHGDTQASNVMVGGRAHDYVGVLDWGSAGWGDEALDFAGLPLRAVPFMLEGYRSVAPLDADDTAEARVLWRHLQLALLTARRDPAPKYSWAERPLTMLLEITRFFLETPPDPWRDLGPA